MSIRMSLNFSDFKDLQKKIEKAAGLGALEDAAEAALKESAQYVNKRLETAMEPHRRSGQTEKSLQTKAKPKKLSAGEISIDVGYKIRKGRQVNLASIVVMHGAAAHNIYRYYGTPKKKPTTIEHPGITADEKVYDAAFGPAVDKKVQEIQRKSLEKAAEKLFK